MPFAVGSVATPIREQILSDFESRLETIASGTGTTYFSSPQAVTRFKRPIPDVFPYLWIEDMGDETEELAIKTSYGVQLHHMRVAIHYWLLEREANAANEPQASAAPTTANQMVHDIKKVLLLTEAARTHGSLAGVVDTLCVGESLPMMESGIPALHGAVHFSVDYRTASNNPSTGV